MPKQLHPQKLAEMLAAGEKIFLLDVRQQQEHDHCHLPESTLIPLNELPERLAEVAVPEGAKIVVYCHHGVRSLSGAAILEANGYPEAFSLYGGIEAWSLLVDPKVPRY
jgi:rhodanese-related sulfurtransferase